MSENDDKLVANRANNDFGRTGVSTSSLESRREIRKRTNVRKLSYSRALGT